MPLPHAGYRLEGDAADSTLELQRFEVWDPAAKVVVHNGAGAPPTVQAPPDTRYFNGALAGAPGSSVVLSVDASGRVSGMAVRGKDTWTLGRAGAAPQAAAAATGGGAAQAPLSSRKGKPSDNDGRPPFHCGGSILHEHQHSPGQQQQTGNQGTPTRKLLAVSDLRRGARAAPLAC